MTLTRMGNGSNFRPADGKATRRIRLTGTTRKLIEKNHGVRCYVLIDFKIDELTHQDLGQMQMYVNYYDRYEKIEGENPTIGILLCKQSDEALVDLTLPENANIYAKEYKLYLPDKKLLQKKLKEWLDEEQN